MKDPQLTPPEFTYDCGSRAAEELESHPEEVRVRRRPVDERKGATRGGNIQRNRHLRH